MSILLDVKNLGISFGGLRAVNEFDLTIQKEQLYGLIGPNGAGKTTVFNLLTGVYKPDAGKVILDGKDITGERNIEISKAGIARTFQNIRLFKQLSVLDNVKAGLHNHHPYSTLSGGEQQMLAMGRALMSKPKIILMDEPSMGLSPIFVNEIFDIIRAVSESGTTVLLVEQNAKKALSISDRAYVLETGTITMSGKAKDLLEDEAVKKAYLGE